MTSKPESNLISVSQLSEEIRHCRACEEHLDPNPVVRLSSQAKLLIIGQAPGTKVHATGIPWNDPSGDRLRSWLGLNREQFYDTRQIAIMPMGFCYPGKGKSGDLPPRKECAELWHGKALRLMPNVATTLLIGQYAQQAYLHAPGKTLSENVSNWQQYFPQYIPLPHPSPRNQLWLKQRPWFEADLVPQIRRFVHQLLEPSLPQG